MAERLCEIDDCCRPHYAKGKCKLHYDQSQPRVRPRRPDCSFDGCVNPRNGTTWCVQHERHVKKYGEPRQLETRRWIVDGMKECSDCRQVLPVSAYNKHGIGIHPKCKDCWSLHGRAIRYGLTRDQVIDMLARPCDSCGEEVEPRWKHIDHDHVSGVVRGILCNSCNVSLGLMNEDANRLRALIDYIERHR